MRSSRQEQSEKPRSFWSPAMPGGAFGLLLFICLFLPSIEGCNNSTYYPIEALGGEHPTFTHVYGAFAFVWPYFFGLTVFISSLWIHRDEAVAWACWLFWAIAFVGIHGCLFFLVTFGTPNAEDQVESLGVVCLVTILTTFFTFCMVLCRNWFNAAMWMQAMLGLTAALSLSTFGVAIALGGRVLFGWKIALCCSILIAMHGIVMRMAGERAVLLRPGVRRRFQLDLRHMILLMLAGGLACSWMISGVLKNKIVDQQRSFHGKTATVETRVKQ